ncbi:MAG: DUF1080 domain-containing protein [Chitinophagaceae bacterium]|nr:DUF1080 domain-containing protein [Chitinophagaceae bacterium]
MKILFTGVLFLHCCLAQSLFAQKQEKGWQYLFDGKTLNGWKQLTGSAKYYVQDSMIVGVSAMGSPNSFLAAEKTYGDFELSFEFMLEDTALNSGVQFRSQFDPARNNGAGLVYGYQYELDGTSRAWGGGIYDEARRGWLYTGAMNGSPVKQRYKHGQFNKALIVCKGNTVQTYLNQMAIATLIDTATTPGLIALQVHSINNAALEGKKIYWKNIRIKTKDVAIRQPEYSSLVTWAPKYVSNTIPNNLSSIEQKFGWKLLFDGKTSSGWKGAYKPGFPEKGWIISDGVLKVLKSTGGESTNGGDIVTVEKFKAFDLSFEFKLTEGANSGVKYFVTLKENNPGSAIGLEYQLLDDARHPDAKMGRDGNRTLSSLYDLITANKQPRFTKPIGEWNTGRVIVYPDNRVEHYLNGVKVLEYVRGSKEFRDLVAISKYKVWENFGEAPEGHILLQDHGDEVHYRSIKIRELKN